MGPRLSKQTALLLRQELLPIWWVMALGGSSAHYRDKHLTWQHQTLEKPFVLIKRGDCGYTGEGDPQMAI